MAEKKSYDSLLLLISLMLCAFGIVAIFSASTELAMSLTGNRFHFLTKQVVFFFIGLFVMLVCAKIPLNAMKSASKLLLLVALILVILVFFIGKTVKGATRWIDFGFANLHPASIAQLTMILFMADFLSRRQSEVNDFRRIIPALVITAIFAALIGISDLSTAIMLVAVMFLMLFASGIEYKYLFFIVLSGISFASVILITQPYRISRIVNWFKGVDVGSLAGNYQSSQSLLSFGLGGATGVGIGQSKQKLFFLPEAQTDYILAIIGEETGFLGVFIILSLFFLFVWRGLKIAKQSVDLFQYYFATGLTIYLGLYAFVNTMVVLSILPSTGLSLPFLSYGGSQLLISLACVGFLLNISSSSRVKQ